MLRSSRPTFFEPVQLHFQPPNLFIQRVAFRFAIPALALPPVHEQLRQLIELGLPPLRDLNRVRLELRSQLTEGLVAADGFDRHPRFELRTVMPFIVLRKLGEI